MEPINQMKLEFLSVPENEGFARVAVSAFAVQLNPTLDILADIKTAVSEAVNRGARWRMWHRGYPPGHAALLHHAARKGAQRHGLFRHADLHG